MPTFTDQKRACNAARCHQKNSLTGIAGRTFVSKQGVLDVNLVNNNIHFGKGFTTEANYGHFLPGGSLLRFSFEVPAVINWDQDLQFAANSIPAA